MNNYLDFLVDLWKITKEDGGFKAYSALIAKHKVNKSISVVLGEDLEWVTDDGKLYIWVGKKPTKKDAETAHLMLKNRIMKQKKDAVKQKALVIKKSGKQIDIIYKSKKNDTLVKEISDLGKSISNMGQLPIIKIDEKTKLPYTDDQLNNDVKNVLGVTAKEVAASKRIYYLEQEYAKSQLQLETERKISFDEIGRLMSANESLVLQMTNLNIINSEMREKHSACENRIELLDNESSYLRNHLNSLHTQLEERGAILAATAKSLDEANTEINNTLKNKIKSWFRK